MDAYLKEPIERPAADEVTLYDLWSALTRRRWLIAATAMLTLLAGIAYVVLVPAYYEYRSGIDIGYVYRGEEMPTERYRFVESAEAAQARLEDLIVPAVRRELQSGEAPLPRVRVEFREINNSLVLISFGTAEQAGEIASLHTAIADALADYHEPRYRQELTLVQRRLRVRVAVLQDELEAVQGQLQLTQERERDGTEGTLLALVDAQRVADLRREYASLQADAAAARAELEGVESASRATQLSFLASQAEQRVGTGRGTIVALSLVLGVLLGVFVAIAAEFASRAKARAAQGL